MEGVFAVILLLLAIAAILIALHRARQNRKAPVDLSSKTDNDLIPKIGEPGSVEPRQVHTLRDLRIQGFDLMRLSKEQAAILQDICTYLAHVWEKEMKDEAGGLEDGVRDRAIKAVLANESYLERIIVSEEAHYQTIDEEIPEDACYWHVVSIFRGTS